MVLISWYDLLYVESYFCVCTLQVNHYIQVFCQILSISILELLICFIGNHSFSWSCSEYYKKFRNKKLQTLLKFFTKRELKFKFMKYLLVWFLLWVSTFANMHESESVCNLCRKRLVGHILLILGILSNMLALGIIYNVYKLSDP